MSSLKVGIVGLPNAGKTTLFNALSRVGAPVAAYPFTTIDANVGVVPVPDSRLERIADLSGCGTRLPATVRFVDIAGLVEGASRGEGLGNRFLANIREVDAIAHVVRGFEAGDVAHVAGSVDPVRDTELIETELRLADLETLAKMIDKARRDAKSGDRECRARVETLCAIEEHVGGGCLTERDSAAARLALLGPDYSLLSLKPTMIVLNVGEESTDSDGHETAMRSWADERGIPVLVVNAEIEAELSELEPGEAKEFEREMGIEEESLVRLVRAAYRLLGLITFFSVDSGVCQAWPIPEGMHACRAAGCIHTDFEKGFVKAEVVHFADYEKSGSFVSAREAGHLLIEGRDYVVRDGDVIHFKFAN